MNRFQIGDHIQSQYGRGKIIASTSQWLIHDNTLNGDDQEFAILLSDDEYELIAIEEKIDSKN